MSEEKDEILERLKKITLLGAFELVKEIESTFEVNSNIPSISANMAFSPSPTNVETSAVEEKTEFDVIIQEVPSSKRIGVIKVVRSLTSLGLKEAKDLIESVPKVVCEGVTKEKAEEAKKLLEEAGASILIK